jgi:hypothetical protein
MSNDRYVWHGKRMFDWHSKEAKVLRAYLRLQATYNYLDEQYDEICKHVDTDGVKIECEEFFERMWRFRAAADRLRDRLGCSNRAAADSFHERNPHLQGESDADYYKRMSEIGAK